MIFLKKNNSVLWSNVSFFWVVNLNEIQLKNFLVNNEIGILKKMS